MSEPQKPDDLLGEIEISAASWAETDNRARKDLLLADRRIVRLGEPEANYREVVFMEEAFQAMVAHGMSNRSIELGGMMIGFNQGDQTIITQFLPSEFSHATGGSLNFTIEDWAAANKAMDDLNRANGTEDVIVGWFHTHPHDYPPQPLTTHDRFIMKNYFPGSDRDNQNDKTTFIMTTYSNNPSEVFASWKWDEPNNQAVLMQGVSIAQKSGRSPRTQYFDPGTISGREIGENEKIVSLSRDEIFGKTEEEDSDEEVKITENAEDHTLVIELTNETGEELTLTLDDQDPAPETIKLSIDEITPDYAKAMIYQINRDPDSPKSNFLRDLLRLAKEVMPKSVSEDIDLVLSQTKSTIDQITIITDDK